MALVNKVMRLKKKKGNIRSRKKIAILQRLRKKGILRLKVLKEISEYRKIVHDLCFGQVPKGW